MRKLLFIAILLHGCKKESPTPTPSPAPSPSPTSVNWDVTDTEYIVVPSVEWVGCPDNLLNGRFTIYPIGNKFAYIDSVSIYDSVEQYRLDHEQVLSYFGWDLAVNVLANHLSQPDSISLSYYIYGTTVHKYELAVKLKIVGHPYNP